MLSSSHNLLAHQLAEYFAKLNEVEAIAWGGSQINGIPDPSSDIDLYVYTKSDISLADRLEILKQSGGASRKNVGLNYWGSGDEWFHAASGIEIDVIYFDVKWVVKQIENVIDHCIARLGYTTCIWHTIRTSVILHDPHGWFQKLCQKSDIKYPEVLRKNIITYNHPVLRNIIPSYTNQLTKAVQRGDLISINHRLTALLASYFDIIFACNRILHPGEKRLMQIAQCRCKSLPANMESDINGLINSICAPHQELLHRLILCLDHLDDWLKLEDIYPFPEQH